MSGIELVGLAASVLQIADLGWKSSYKLYTFSKKVHDAAKTIELISQDVAATGVILQQLGEELQKDEDATPDSRLCSKGLVDAASKLVAECKALFNDIDKGITGESGSKVILGFKQKLKWSYLEPRVELLRANLERLKSSLALMLNVLMYAEQRRNRQEQSVLSEQQDLVASFAKQKAESEKRIEGLERAIEHGNLTAMPKAIDSNTSHALNFVEDSVRNLDAPKPVSAKPANVSVARNPPYLLSTRTANETATVQLSHSPFIATLVSSLTSKPSVGSRSAIEHITLQEPSGAHEQHPQLEDHRLLIETILEEVNSSKYAIDHGLRYRLHDGVLELHWREWEPWRAIHGDETLPSILSKSPVLARHWYTKSNVAESGRSIADLLHHQRASRPIPTNSDFAPARRNMWIQHEIDADSENNPLEGDKDSLHQDPSVVGQSDRNPDIIQHSSDPATVTAKHDATPPPPSSPQQQESQGSIPTVSTADSTFRNVFQKRPGHISLTPALAERPTDLPEPPTQRKSKRKSGNALHGRHGNDWLFEGVSIKDLQLSVTEAGAAVVAGRSSSDGIADSLLAEWTRIQVPRR